ncbi:ycf2 [Acrasis kona]|uniref:Ycf2 n=1 Tax=Acrasis kona TaxID=1008807 RepID=A0AAW2Z8I1_9EUKA
MLTSNVHRFFNRNSNSILIENINGRQVTVVVLPDHSGSWTASCTDQETDLCSTTKSESMDEAILLGLYELQVQLTQQGVAWKV